MKANLWNGHLICDEELSKNISELTIDKLILKPLSNNILFEALKKLIIKLSTETSESENILKALSEVSLHPKKELEDFLTFINVDSLRKKIAKEFGDEHPFELKRIGGRDNAFEAWYPLGVITHITPNNSTFLSASALIEGLLTGNVNFVKLGRKENSLTSLIFKFLVECDNSDEIKKYIYILKLSSSQKNELQKIYGLSNVISVWGNEETVQSVKEIAPKGVKVVSWGHKISFSLFTKNYEQTDLKKLAQEITIGNQLFCSSPQVVYLINANFEDLKVFGKLLEKELIQIKREPCEISPEEYAEITVNNEVLKLKSINEECELIDGGSFRIYIENNEILKASPLYRTIWVKSLNEENIIHSLRPFAEYLQTVGISCLSSEYEILVNKLILAGALRIRNIGQMQVSYEGESHDGVLALTQYCKKISVYDDIHMNNKYSFELDNQKSTFDKKRKIMSKVDFQTAIVEEKYSDLFFYSGGSTGGPKLSRFTYTDYHRQMQVAAEGLFAAGLNPATDRSMNLFYAGNLYGGFTSFFTILEFLKVVQFPMGASSDFSMVGETIVENNVDTLLGMPSYLLELFKNNHELFKKYKGIKKIFFGGEHFPKTQRQFLQNEYGVELIRSASYGSVDAGPLGFQCPFSNDKVYHLHEKLHDLEVVKIENDIECSIGEIGRLLFSSKVRHGQELKRYDIGDIGKIIEGQCQCGRRGVRFELLGRHGDVFRIGTMFFSYQKFEKILIDEFDFKGQMQIELLPRNNNSLEIIQLKVTDVDKTNEEISYSVLANYKDLSDAIILDKVLTFNVIVTNSKELEFNPKTGKLRTVLDRRV